MPAAPSASVFINCPFDRQYQPLLDAIVFCVVACGSEPRCTLELTYDPGTKTFTYTAEIEPMPGVKQQAREVVKLGDKDHMTLEWYENRGGQEKKTMEINYTRKK